MWAFHGAGVTRRVELSQLRFREQTDEHSHCEYGHAEGDHGDDDPVAWTLHDLIRENVESAPSDWSRPPWIPRRINGISRAAGRSKAMPYSISTLLTRNLHDVFGENDGTRRRAAIDEIYTEDCVFYDPTKGVYRGRDEIDRVAGKIKATHPDFRYQPIVGPEELGNGGRIQWVSGRPGEAPAYAGTDFIIARDGRIAALYLFFDKLP
jgi:hypothetical protein